VKYRVSVCKGPDCRRNGADKVYYAAREKLFDLKLSERCDLYRGGCYGLCHLGPNVVVRPDDRKRDPLSREDFQLMGWPGEAYYWQMNAEKVGRVVAEHVGGGGVASDLLGDPTREEDFRKNEP
jgi:(2Fe-2S) ferredoxin